MRCTLTRVGLALSLLTIGSSAVAQTAPPTLQMVSPTGAQRGTTVTVTITGTNIADPSRIIFSEPGFTAKVTAVKEVPMEKRMTPKGVVRTDAPIEDKARKYELSATVAIAPDALHGVHAFRLETPLGVSNLLRFAVSSLPEMAEREPNGSDAPQKVTLPSALVGSLATLTAMRSARAPAKRWSSRSWRGRSARAWTASCGSATRRETLLRKTTTSI
jgi:hypothetical protein